MSLGLIILGFVLVAAAVIGFYGIVKEENEHWIIWLLLLMTLGSIIFRAGVDDDLSYKDQAIEKGFGHYVIIDKETGRTEFQWKDLKQFKENKDEK